MRPDVHDAYQLITDFLTDTFSPDQLLAFIGSQRNKAHGVQVLRLNLPPGTTGCAIGLRDADVIGIRKDVTADLYWFMFGHEASHFLLKHVPSLSAGDNTASLAEFLRSTDIQHALFRDRTISKHDPKEMSAEQLGRHVKKCFDRYRAQLPESLVRYHALKP